MIWLDSSVSEAGTEGGSWEAMSHRYLLMDGQMDPSTATIESLFDGAGLSSYHFGVCRIVREGFSNDALLVFSRKPSRETDNRKARVARERLVHGRVLRNVDRKLFVVERGRRGSRAPVILSYELLRRNAAPKLIIVCNRRIVWRLELRHSAWSERSNCATASLHAGCLSTSEGQRGVHPRSPCRVPCLGRRSSRVRVSRIGRRDLRRLGAIRSGYHRDL